MNWDSTMKIRDDRLNDRALTRPRREGTISVPSTQTLTRCTGSVNRAYPSICRDPRFRAGDRCRVRLEANLDPFVDQLKHLCVAYPTRAKWVFVPTHAIGRTLGERIVLEGTDWLNLRFVTPLDIALRWGRRSLSNAASIRPKKVSAPR